MSDTRPSIILNRIKSMFSDMGRASGLKSMHPPASTDNRDGIAWELHIAKELETLAKKRRIAATLQAIDSGVMFDSDKDPLNPGDKVIIYDGDLLQVQVKVSTPSTTVDMKAFKNALEVAGVKAAVIAKCEKSATKANKAAHNFSTILKGGAYEDTAVIK